MKFYLYMLSGIAWPLAMVWITHQFKTEIRALLNRLFQNKQTNFSSPIQPIFKPDSLNAFNADLLKKHETSHYPSVNQHEYLHYLANTSPREAIIQSWLMINIAAMQFEKISTNPHLADNPKLMIKTLFETKLFSAANQFMLNYLLSIRIMADQATPFNLTPTEVLSYIELIQSAVKLIDNSRLELS